MRQGSNTGRRPRGRPNRRQHGSGNNQRSGNFDSNGPDGRIRGSASQVYEKYMTFARDAASSGDRVAAEAYFQHAEHYYRILNDSTDPRSESQPPARQQRGNGRDARDSRDANGQGGETHARPSPAAEGNGQSLAGAPQPESPPEAFGLSSDNETSRSSLEDVGFLRAEPRSPAAERAGAEPSAKPAVSGGPETADGASQAGEPKSRPRRGRPPKRTAAEGDGADAKPRRGRPPKTVAPDEKKAAGDEIGDGSGEIVSP